SRGRQKIDQQVANVAGQAASGVAEAGAGVEAVGVRKPRSKALRGDGARIVDHSPAEVQGAPQAEVGSRPEGEGVVAVGLDGAGRRGRELDVDAAVGAPADVVDVEAE